MSTIADNLQTLIDCKADMKSAIEEKGVTVSGGLSTYADAIRSIEKGDVTIIGDIDFTILGYNDSESKNCNNDIVNTINYSKDILDNWDKNTTNAFNYFQRNYPNVRYVPVIDTSNITGTAEETDENGNIYTRFDGFNGTFSHCHQLIYLPELNTENAVTMESMFYGCIALRTIPKFNTSKVKTMCQMFMNCYDLKTIPEIDTGNVIDMNAMFYNCFDLETIPEIDTHSVKKMVSTFTECASLKSLPLLDCSNVLFFNPIGPYGTTYEYELTDIAGFKNLGKNSRAVGNVFDGNFLKLEKLTKQSCLNIFNNLYDRKTAGYSVLTLRFAKNVLDLLSDNDIAIATTKGWTVTSDSPF